MKAYSRIRLLLLGASLATLAGCATYPVAQKLRKAASPLTLAEVMQNPGTYKGALVIWGGRIIKTVNETNGAEIYVLKLPLNRHEHPIRYANATGRFIARTKGFLDPEVYRGGHLVTVAGKIVGQLTEPLQKVKYTYPILDIQQLHVWPRYQRHYYYPVWGWSGYNPGWWGYYPAWGVGWGWYYPGWDLDENYPGDWD